MGKIFSLVRQDVRNIRRSVMASCMMALLFIIPLLFTWFNVLASWDPFGNAENLKIAVASEDKGFESDLFPMNVNVGDRVLNELQANDQLDWVVTDAEDAIDGTRSGEYYASIVLPQTFSSDMLTFYADGSEPADITLRVNEKKNALGPTIADRGAQGVTTNIAESFTRTLGDVSFALVSSLSDFLGREGTQEALGRLQARAEGVQTQLHNAAESARSLAGLVGSSVPLMESAQSIADAPKPELPEGLGMGDDVLGGPTVALDEALSAARDSYRVLGERIDEVYAAAEKNQGSRNDVLNRLADDVQNGIDATQGLRNNIPAGVAPSGQLTGLLDEAINAQESVRDRLRAAATTTSPERPDFSSLERASRALDNLRNSTLLDQVKELGQTLRGIGDNITMPDVELNLDPSTLTTASESVNRVADVLDQNAHRFGEVKNTLAEVGKTGNFAELAKLVGDDPDALAGALAAPISVDRQAVFPVQSFGAGMAPLYTALALWVGSLLSVVSLRTNVKRKDMKPVQKYFGRYGIFALVGLVQSTLLTGGLIFFVELKPAHPFLLVLAGWVTSLVFMLLAYTFVVTFSNSGKAMSVLLLVMQISSAGGAYPLQLLPGWFQGISPLLPATYTINAMRSAIGGIYEGDYWLSLGTLLIFALVAIFLGLVVRKPMENYNRKLGEALERTKVM